MRTGILAALFLIAGCGGGNYVIVVNGGGAVTPGTCSDVGLVARADTMKVVPAGEQGCEATRAFLVAHQATAVFWQIADSPWAGPALANRVELQVPGALIVGNADKALAAGQNQKGLTSGDSGRALVAGQDQKGLTSGQDQKGLAAAPAAKALTSGDSGHALVSGQDQKAVVLAVAAPALVSGQDQTALTGGRAAVALVSASVDVGVAELVKSVNRTRAARGETVEFEITVRNIGHTPLARTVIVDRVSPRLSVTKTEAHRHALEDGSSLLVWTLTEAVPPEGRATVRFSAVVQ